MFSITHPAYTQLLSLMCLSRECLKSSAISKITEWSHDATGIGVE
jgi:hypothetical protein